jgi:hypothetical protein
MKKCADCDAENPDDATNCLACNKVSFVRPSLKASVPFWGYIFAGACGILPVLTLGGAIPAGVGIGGAGACLKISSDQSKSVVLRISVCAAIVVVCWLIVWGVVLWLLSRRRNT